MSAPDGPHVGPIYLAIRVTMKTYRATILTTAPVTYIISSTTTHIEGLISKPWKSVNNPAGKSRRMYTRPILSAGDGRLLFFLSNVNKHPQDIKPGSVLDKAIGVWSGRHFITTEGNSPKTFVHKFIKAILRGNIPSLHILTNLLRIQAILH